MLGKNRTIQIPPSTHVRNILVIRILPSKHDLHRADLSIRNLSAPKYLDNATGILSARLVKACLIPSACCWADIGTRTEAGTGSPGYIPVENLAWSIEAGPDGDVFSFAVLMLFIFVKKELRENNMFAHTVRSTGKAPTAAAFVVTR